MQVLVHVSTCQGNPFWYRFFEPQSPGPTEHWPPCTLGLALRLGRVMRRVNPDARQMKVWLIGSIRSQEERMILKAGKDKRYENQSLVART